MNSPVDAQQNDAVRRLVGGCYLALREQTLEYIPEGLTPEMLENSGLVPLYGALCARLGRAVDPESIAAGMLLKATNQRRWSGLQAILDSLRQTGIEPVIFKGGAIVARWPELLDLRIMDDFDLLVPQAQLKKLRQSFALQGFEESATPFPASRWLKKGAMVWHGEGVNHQNLDLHSRVTEPPTCRSLTMSMLASKDVAQGIRVPGVEDCVGMIALHIVRSGMARPLKEYIDLLWYTDGVDATQWRAIVANAKKHRLDAALFLSLRQAIHCSALHELDPRRARLLQDRLDALGMGLSRWRRAMIDRYAAADHPLAPNPRYARPFFRRSVVMFVGVRSPARVIAAFLAYGFSRLADQTLALFKRPATADS